MPLPTTTLRFPNRYSRQGHYCVLCVIELACACVPMLRARTGQIRRFWTSWLSPDRPQRPPAASVHSRLAGPSLQGDPVEPLLPRALCSGRNGEENARLVHVSSEIAEGTVLSGWGLLELLGLHASTTGRLSHNGLVSHNPRANSPSNVPCHHDQPGVVRRAQG